MRVLHVISEMGIGGAESLVTEMVCRGDDFGWTSAVASGGGTKADTLVGLGFRHYAVPPARRSLRGVVRARRHTAHALRDFEPDVIVAHNVSASLVTWLARPRVPVATVFHGVAQDDYRNAARILRLTSCRTIVVAQSVAGRLRSAGLNGKGINVIANAVAMPEPIEPLTARRELGIAPDRAVALCLARMEPQKRHDVLLDAWEKLSDDELLLLAGDGSLRATLEARAERLGDRVRFLGRRTDVRMLLAATDVTVLASDWEGMPMAILESLAASRPVVATDVDGVRELLGYGGGRLTPAGDAESFAAAVRELLGDHSARQQAAAQGVATIRSHYDPLTMMKQYDEVLRGTIDEMEA